MIKEILSKFLKIKIIFKYIKLKLAKLYILHKLKDEDYFYTNWYISIIGKKEIIRLYS